jgi:hypothetical protein
MTGYYGRGKVMGPDWRIVVPGSSGKLRRNGYVYKENYSCNPERSVAGESAGAGRGNG